MRNCVRPYAYSVPLPVPYSGGIAAGQGMLVGALFGVALSDAAQNELVECAVVGEYEISKDPTQAITVGQRVFWDGTNRRITTTATGNFHVGFATAAASATDTTVRVLLARGPASGS